MTARQNAKQSRREARKARLGEPHTPSSLTPLDVSPEAARARLKAAAVNGVVTLKGDTMADWLRAQGVPVMTHEQAARATYKGEPLKAMLAPTAPRLDGRRR